MEFELCNYSFTFDFVKTWVLNFENVKCFKLSDKQVIEQKLIVFYIYSDFVTNQFKIDHVQIIS